MLAGEVTEGARDERLADADRSEDDDVPLRLEVLEARQPRRACACRRSLSRSCRSARASRSSRPALSARTLGRGAVASRDLVGQAEEHEVLERHVLMRLSPTSGRTRTFAALDPGRGSRKSRALHRNRCYSDTHCQRHLDEVAPPVTISSSHRAIHHPNPCVTASRTHLAAARSYGRCAATLVALMILWASCSDSSKTSSASSWTTGGGSKPTEGSVHRPALHRHGRLRRQNLLPLR